MIFNFGNCVSVGIGQNEKDEQIIQDYIKKNSLVATRHTTGFYYVINSEGTGINPRLQDSIVVNYSGYTANDNVFDATTAATGPRTFYLGGMIAGWQFGVPLIKEGGKIKLLLPSSLAYGNAGVGPIAPNSVLIFDINLVKIK